MKCLLTNKLPKPSTIAEPTVLVAGIAGAGWTRSMLSFSADQRLVTGVIGWLDISSPNLVDLVDELWGSHGGTKLLGLRFATPRPTDDELPLARGLATVAEFDLSVWIDAGTATPDLCRRFPKMMVRTLPGLGI